MPVRDRRSRTASAIALAAALTAGTALLLTGCGPTPGSPSGSPSGSASTPAKSTAPGGAAPGSPVNGTKGNALTISTGYQYVVMNGTTVDFGSVVRDLAWSPSGRGPPSSTARVTWTSPTPTGAAAGPSSPDPGNQAWSHPTWQVTGADQEGIAPRTTSSSPPRSNGITRLEEASATANHGTPDRLTLDHGAGQNVRPEPRTGNTWPNGGRTAATGPTVYENTATGEVYIRDDYLRQRAAHWRSGSEPALSPNGEDVVFVRSVGGHDHIFEEVASRQVRRSRT